MRTREEAIADPEIGDWWGYGPYKYRVVALVEERAKPGEVAPKRARMEGLNSKKRWRTDFTLYADPNPEQDRVNLASPSRNAVFLGPASGSFALPEGVLEAAKRYHDLTYGESAK